MCDYVRQNVQNALGTNQHQILSQRYLGRQTLYSIVMVLSGLVPVAGQQQTDGPKDVVSARTTPDEQSIDGKGKATVSATPENPAPDKYKSFGATQVFTTKSSLWVFLDIDAHEHRGTYAEPPSTRSPIEFRAYQIDQAGVVKEWRSQTRDVRAHPNLSAIFRHQGDTYVYSFDTHHCFKLVSKKEEHGAVMPASLPPLDGVTESTDATPGILPDAAFEKTNECEGFKQLGYTNYGYGPIPSGEFLAEKLGIRMRFHTRDHILGWLSLSIEYHVDDKQKTAVLLDLRKDGGC